MEAGGIAVVKERNLKIVLAYQGTAYHGFQWQENALSIQEVVEKGLSVLFAHPVKVAGSGRTDTGVHALGQVISFRTTGRIPTEKIAIASRGVFPDDIVLLSAEEVAADFHARCSATSKIYEYRIYHGKLPDPFRRHQAWHISRQLDLDAMREALRQVEGTHDFSAFQGAGGHQINTVKTIYEASIAQENDEYKFRFWGSGFLYHMVRNLVGTAVAVGDGKIKVDDMSAIIESRNRRKAGMTAPAQGLYLKEVFY